MKYKDVVLEVSKHQYVKIDKNTKLQQQYKIQEIAKAKKIKIDKEHANNTNIFKGLNNITKELFNEFKKENLDAANTNSFKDCIKIALIIYEKILKLDPTLKEAIYRKRTVEKTKYKLERIEHTRLKNHSEVEEFRYNLEENNQELNEVNTKINNTIDILTHSLFDTYHTILNKDKVENSKLLQLSILSSILNNQENVIDINKIELSKFINKDIIENMIEDRKQLTNEEISNNEENFNIILNNIQVENNNIITTINNLALVNNILNNNIIQELGRLDVDKINSLYQDIDTIVNDNEFDNTGKISSNPNFFDIETNDEYINFNMKKETFIELKEYIGLLNDLKISKDLADSNSYELLNSYILNTKLFTNHTTILNSLKIYNIVKEWDVDIRDYGLVVDTIKKITPDKIIYLKLLFDTNIETLATINNSNIIKDKTQYYINKYLNIIRLKTTSNNIIAVLNKMESKITSIDNATKNILSKIKQDNIPIDVQGLNQENILYTLEYINRDKLNTGSNGIKEQTPNIEGENKELYQHYLEELYTLYKKSKNSFKLESFMNGIENNIKGD